MTAAEFANRLGARRVGRSWVARCPAHQSRRRNNLRINAAEDGTVLLSCLSRGCTAGDIVAAMGLRLSDLFPEEQHRLDDDYRLNDWDRRFIRRVAGLLRGERTWQRQFAHELNVLSRPRVPRGLRHMAPEQRRDLDAWVAELEAERA